MRLIDADALLEKFNKKTDIYTALTDEKTSQDFALYCHIADALDEMPTVGGWISVKDRLPESGKHVLVCCEIRPSKKRYVCDGFYASKHNIASHYVEDDFAYEYDEEADEYFLLEGWYEVIKNWDEYSSIVIEDFVTHWMPLPEPPKKDEKDDSD